MQAVAKVKREVGVEVIEVEPDPIPVDGALLRMKSASICGSDLGFYNFTAAFQKFARIPVIMGHEFAGEIEAVGKEVKGFNPGDRVVSESVVYCGFCRHCMRGKTNICKNFTLFGMHRNGGFAEKVSVDPRLLHRIPEGVSFLEAGIVEPLTVAINGIGQIRDIGLDQTAVVVGPGPIGLLSAEVLRLRGVGDITVVGVGADGHRLKLASEKLGYKTINWEAENATEAVYSRTDGYGADFVVVTAASASALKSAMPLVSKGGQLVLLGIIPDEVSLALADMVRKEVSILGSYAARGVHYEQALAVLREKKVRANEIVTDTFRLDQAKEAFQVALSKSGCKVQFHAND
jgi:L-iditol 2-dehydrogenase